MSEYNAEEANSSLKNKIKRIKTAARKYSNNKDEIYHKDMSKAILSAYKKKPNRHNRLLERGLDELRLVNCAGCGTELLGESEESFRDYCIEIGARYALALPPSVMKRINGRPVCFGCGRKLMCK